LICKVWKKIKLVLKCNRFMFLGLEMLVLAKENILNVTW
jgi:hypothetical protein